MILAHFISLYFSKPTKRPNPATPKPSTKPVVDPCGGIKGRRKCNKEPGCKFVKMKCIPIPF